MVKEEKDISSEKCGVRGGVGSSSEALGGGRVFGWGEGAHAGSPIISLLAVGMASL